MVKRLLFIFILIVIPTLGFAQGVGGQVRRVKKQETTANNGKKGKKQRIVKKRNQTVRQSEEHPIQQTVEADSVGYNVSFTCNVPTAILNIDGTLYDSAKGMYYLKAGKHSVVIRAEGYEDYYQDIVVDHNAKLFVFELQMKQEAIGYDVEILCNVTSATLTVDGAKFKSLKDVYFLKTGRHSVNLEAEGYEPINTEIDVNSNSVSFVFTMNRIEKHLPDVIQKLLDNMIPIDGGSFIMGLIPNQGKKKKKGEKPPHKVIVSSFKLSKYEVTKEEWHAVMEDNSDHISDRIEYPQYPIVGVSWNDCQAFIIKLNEITGKQFRLPTEAEWEYAARGGRNSKDYRYSGGNDIGFVAWYERNSSDTSHAVGSLYPNELGLYDMSGNVWEWCHDLYGPYSPEPQMNPSGAVNGDERVIRGASFSEEEDDCRICLRNKANPEKRTSFLGFRLAM